MKSSYLALISLCAGLFVSNTVAWAQLPPMVSIDASGSGCPSGIQVLPVGENALLLSFNSGFAVELGPGIPLSESRKNCALRIGFADASNFRITPLSSAFAGEVDIYGSPSLDLRTDVAFAGTPVLDRAIKTWLPSMDPLKGLWKDVEAVPLPGSVISNCANAAELDLRFTLRMTGKSPTSGGSARANYLLVHFNRSEC